MADRGMKRICAECGTKFYDFGKSPIVCPSCGTQFTGEIAVQSKRKQSSIQPDTVKRDQIEAKNAASTEDDDDTISLNDVDEGSDDDDLDIDNLDGMDDDNDDDLSDLDGDIDIDVDDEDSR